MKFWYISVMLLLYPIEDVNSYRKGKKSVFVFDGDVNNAKISHQHERFRRINFGRNSKYMGKQYQDLDNMLQVLNAQPAYVVQIGPTGPTGPTVAQYDTQSDEDTDTASAAESFSTGVICLQAFNLCLSVPTYN